MASDESLSIRNEVSTSSPLSLPASAALARPAPIDAATSATVTGWSYCRTDPSGKRTETISFSKTPAHAERFRFKHCPAIHFKNRKAKKMRPRYRGAAFTFHTYRETIWQKAK